MKTYKEEDYVKEISFLEFQLERDDLPKEIYSEYLDRYTSLVLITLDIDVINKTTH